MFAVIWNPHSDYPYRSRWRHTINDAINDAKSEFASITDGWRNYGAPSHPDDLLDRLRFVGDSHSMFVRDNGKKIDMTFLLIEDTHHLATVSGIESLDPRR